jgi:hypothetical protein
MACFVLWAPPVEDAQRNPGEPRDLSERLLHLYPDYARTKTAKERGDQ